jgi:hypothetical protein
MMNLIPLARQLADHIANLPDFQISQKGVNTTESMGGIIADAILQAGLNYRTVVFPRVERIVSDYPEAATTSGFIELADKVGYNTVLGWNHPEKPRRAHSLAQLLAQEHIDTKDQLREWLQDDNNCSKLTKIPGIGPKTVDYLKNLAGLSEIAVDRHIRKCALDAGIAITDYHVVRRVFQFAADLLNVQRNELDHSIWLYMSKGGRAEEEANRKRDSAVMQSGETVRSDCTPAVHGL